MMDERVGRLLDEMAESGGEFAAQFFADVCDKAVTGDEYAEQRADLAMNVIRRIKGALNIFVSAVENDCPELAARAMIDLNIVTEYGPTKSAGLSLMFLFGGDRMGSVMIEARDQTDEAQEWDQRYAQELVNQGVKTYEDEEDG